MFTRITRAATGLLAFALASNGLAQGDNETMDRPEKDGDGNAIIHFADINGIRSWRPMDNGQALLIEGNNDQWYLARSHGRCFGLPYALALGFVTDRSGHLDRFSSVLVDGERCYFRSLSKTEAPDEANEQNAVTP